MTRTITQKQLDEWQAICDAASPGPWEADVDDPGTPHETWTGKFYTGPKLEQTWCTYGGEDPDSVHVANARFCALARSALPRLISALRPWLDKNGRFEVE